MSFNNVVAHFFTILWCTSWSNVHSILNNNNVGLLSIVHIIRNYYFHFLMLNVYIFIIYVNYINPNVTSIEHILICNDVLMRPSFLFIFMHFFQFTQQNDSYLPHFIFNFFAMYKYYFTSVSHSNFQSPLLTHIVSNYAQLCP